MVTTAASTATATADIELFLREGCHLRYAGNDDWWAIPRRGNPEQVARIGVGIVTRNEANFTRYRL